MGFAIASGMDANTKGENTMYKVALEGGLWKRGFTTLAEASAYANLIFKVTGNVAAVEAYQPKRKV
jgi:hypothetical protein